MPTKAGRLTRQTQRYLGFAAADYIGLTSTQQARVFGVVGRRGNHLAGVKRRLRSRTSVDDYHRLKYLMEIAASLRILLKTQERAGKWMNQLNMDFDNKSPKEMIVPGYLPDMRRVAHRLETLVKAKTKKRAR